MAAKIRLHSSSGAREVVSGTLIYSGFFLAKESYIQQVPDLARPCV